MTVINHVWSSYGHRFMSTGQVDESRKDASYESCLTCGGEWTLAPDDPEDPEHGAYVNSLGAEPIECPGLNDWQHGAYIDEMMCDAGTDDYGNRNGSPCEAYEAGADDCGHWAVTHGCNCNVCEG